MRKQRRSGRFFFFRRGEERDKERSSAKREVAPWNRGWGGVVPGGEGGLIFNKQGAIFAATNGGVFRRKSAVFGLLFGFVTF